MTGSELSFAKGIKLDPSNLDESLKALEEYMVALKIERSSAQTALHAHSEFVTTISHEIRTSLGAIFAFTDLLMASELNEEQHGHASNLRSSTENLLSLLDEVLDHSRLTEGRMELTVKSFSLNELVNSFGVNLQARCSVKGLASNIHVSADLPSMVEGDPMRIRQILVNFADNAVKFTEEGTVRFRVERVGNYPGGVIVRFSMTDTGAGFDQQTRDHMFEPYQHKGEAGDDTEARTGLGLAISSKLVALMGGEIRCESEPGHGSKFWFDVPLNSADDDIDDELFADPLPRQANQAEDPEPGSETELAYAEAEDVPADNGPLRTTRPSHVLIVEDNKVDQMLVTTYLKKFGHTFTLAEDGFEAVNMVKATKFDVVLMELQLPELDGFQAAAAIRKLDGPRADIPIVAITGNVLHSRRESWKHADLDDCLTKPIDALHLFKTIAHFRDNGRAVPTPPPDLPELPAEESGEEQRESDAQELA